VPSCVVRSSVLVRSVTFSRSGDWLLSGSGDGVVRLWDLLAGTVLRRFEGHQDGVYHAVFDRGETRALSGGRDRSIRLWDLSTGSCLRAIHDRGAHVQCLAWHSDQRRFVSCAGDIRLWDSETGECLRVYDGHTDTIQSVVWSHDGQEILSASHDGTVRI
jgi:WD40 repeat protein